MAPHLGERQVEQDLFGAGRGVGRGAHVHDAGVAHVDQRAARHGELQDGEGGQALGVGLHGGAGQGERRGGAGHGQAVDGDGHALLGEQDGRLEAVGVVLQRAHRAVDDREDGALGPPHAARARGREDLHDVGHVGGVGDLALHVLGAAGEHGLQAAQRLQVGLFVAGVGGVPEHADLVERVGDGHGFAQVAGRRGAPLAGTVVEAHGAHAVVGGPGARVVEQRVLFGVARGQQHVLGGAGEGRLDELARQAHDLRLFVDRGARVAQQRLGAGQRHAHADLGEQPQRLRVHVVDGRFVEHAQSRAQHAGEAAARRGSSMRAPGRSRRCAAGRRTGSVSRGDLRSGSGRTGDRVGRGR